MNGPYDCGNRRGLRAAPVPVKSALAEGHAVGALVHGGVTLMGADMDLVQRTVIFCIAVVGAGDDGTFDALVSMTIHDDFLLKFCIANSGADLVCPPPERLCLANS